MDLKTEEFVNLYTGLKPETTHKSASRAAAGIT